MTATPPSYPSQQGQQPQYAPQGQAAAAYQGQAPAGYAPVVKPLPTNTTAKDTNTYALVGVILTFIVPLAGIIFGHMALSQIKRTGDAGRGLAMTAVIYGYACFVTVGLFLILYIGFIIFAINMAMNAATGGSGFYS